MNAFTFTRGCANKTRFLWSLTIHRPVLIVPNFQVLPPARAHLRRHRLALVLAAHPPSVGLDAHGRPRRAAPQAGRRRDEGGRWGRPRCSVRAPKPPSFYITIVPKHPPCSNPRLYFLNGGIPLVIDHTRELSQHWLSLPGRLWIHILPLSPILIVSC